jgi:hypothetical protein
LRFANRKDNLEAAMKFRAISRAFGAAILFATLSSGPGAKAFTIEDQSGGRSGQAFMDLDKPTAAPDRHMPVSPFNTENGQTTLKQGNATLQFGQQRSFGEKYNTDNIFNPYTREGR